MTARRVSSSPSAWRRLTLFGGENTRSKPATGASLFVSSRRSSVSGSIRSIVISRALRVRAQLVLGVRMDAADQPPELALLHDAFELELARASPDPDARRLAVALVVLVEPGGDGPLVVALLPRCELRDTQHDPATLAFNPFMG